MEPLILQEFEFSFKVALFISGDFKPLEVDKEGT